MNARRWTASALIVCALLLPASPATAAGVIVGRSEIAFTVTAMGVKFDGRFRKWNADVVFEPASLAKSRAQVDIDLASVDLAGADTEAEARGPLWFDSARFPAARFSSTSIESRGGGRYDVIGRLSLKGVTRDCVVPITVTRASNGERIAEGSFALRRLDYRVGEGEWSDTGTVSGDVIVRIRMVLSPQA
ncbi:MAG TPA: YceI family protein [Casimicrobiaceae bacterium]|nr:YceI family protein [Casimicrobiaceae bacterium]